MESIHDNIIECFGCFDYDGAIHLLMPVMAKSLEKCLSPPVEQDSVLKKISKSICCGLQFIHSKTAIHNDLKCENVLLSRNGAVKLADFGCLEYYKEITPVTTTVINKDPKTSESSGPQKAMRDIWAFGILLVQVADGTHPFAGYHEIEIYGLSLGLVEPPTPSNGTSEFKAFVKQCLKLAPAERSNLSTLLSDDFIQNITDENEEKYLEWVNEKLD